MNDAIKNKRVVVIGAGLGGMSAAIILASKGFQVTILEKNAQVGGKLNQLQAKGFSFDLGPSIFTLPEIFRPVFEGDGKRLEDYITLQRVDPQWRNFFEDGVVVDLWEDSERMGRSSNVSARRFSESIRTFSHTHAANTKYLNVAISATVSIRWHSSSVFMAGRRPATLTTCTRCRAAFISV